MSGIVLSWHCDIAVPHSLSLLAVSLFVTLFGLLRFSPKWLFGVGAMAFMFATGLFVEQCQHGTKELQWSERKGEYSAVLIEEPAVRGTNVKVLANVTATDSVFSRDERREGLAYLYFMRTVESDALAVGDVVSFEAAMQTPKNAGNPAEFDNEEYCYIKGVTGSVFLRDGNWNMVGKGRMTLAMRALETRKKVVDLYGRLGFEKEEHALLSALTVGEKRDFPRELKEAYSAAGASHVLALSGLHLGIFYLLLSLIIPLRGRKRFVLVAREILIVLSLWVFAFVAGLSPSVVRAAILFSLVSLGRCLHQDYSSVNSLAFAAIAMLLFSPHLLFDVSFQLSFSAVFAILLLVPHMQNLFRVEKHGALYGYVVNLFLLSFAAQVGTLPFIWYHFGVLPLYSLLTNAVVVPLAFVVIAMALVMLATSFYLPLQHLVADALGGVIGFMNNSVSYISSLPGATYSLPPIGAVGAVCVGALSVLLAIGAIKRKWWLVMLTVGCSLLFVVVESITVDAGKDNEAFLVYNNRKNPLVHIVGENGCNWLLSTVPQLDAEYEYVSSAYVKRERIEEPVWVDGDFSVDEFTHSEGLVEYKGLKIKMLADGLWPENRYTTPVDVLLLCRGFLGSIEELYDVYPCSCLLLDASLYSHSRARILRECAQLGVEAVDISATGAINVVPKGDSFEIVPMKGK